VKKKEKVCVHVLYMNIELDIIELIERMCFLLFTKLVYLCLDCNISSSFYCLLLSHM